MTNPIDVETFEPLTLEAGSAAQEIAAKAHGASVVKAFNSEHLTSDPRWLDAAPRYLAVGAARPVSRGGDLLPAAN